VPTTGIHIYINNYINVNLLFWASQRVLSFFLVCSSLKVCTWHFTHSVK
jgi:hypothetical protein